MADGEDEAARAFEDLRAEVSLMRRAVERVEPSNTPDYAETLGVISRNLSTTAQRIDAVVNSPALALTPHEFGRQIIEVGTAGRSEDRRAIAAARQLIEEVATKLGRQLDSHLMADDQRGRVRSIGLLGLVLGMVMWVTLAGPIARSLPESWLLPERMAARTLRMPMWEGGQRLMRAASPRAYAGILAGDRLVTATRETLEACRRKEVKAKKVAR
jgi:hypothetical protein